MDRVFSKARIHDICDNLKDIMKECSEHLEDIKGTSNEARSAAARVPAEASTGTVESAAGNFMSAMGALDFQVLTTKLSGCKSRVDLITSQDKSYSADTDSIKMQIDAIKRVLAKMEGFLGRTSLSTDYKEFMVSTGNGQQ